MTTEPVPSLSADPDSAFAKPVIAGTRLPVASVWGQLATGLTIEESSFGSLKKERVRKKVYRARELARADLFEYIEMSYNRERRHGHLGGVGPVILETASIGSL